MSKRSGQFSISLSYVQHLLSIDFTSVRAFILMLFTNMYRYFISFKSRFIVLSIIVDARRRLLSKSYNLFCQKLLLNIAHLLIQIFIRKNGVDLFQELVALLFVLDFFQLFVDQLKESLFQKQSIRVFCWRAKHFFHTFFV